MTTQMKRIAINAGGGYVPGLNAVIAGAVRTASELGWEVIAIRDGFDELLFSDRYPEDGLSKLTRKGIENLFGTSGCILGTAAHSDPFHVRTVDTENQVEEVDRSDELIERLKKERIDAVISIVSSRAFGILWKLNRKGLKTVCVLTSVENDVAATMLSFGFNSTLSFTTEMIDRMRQAAQGARKIGVVEVLGRHSGWLALQAGMAVCADAVLIPEIPYDLSKVATKLHQKIRDGWPGGLVVVAEGATPVSHPESLTRATSADPLRASLSPGATGSEGLHVIERSGNAAEAVALELQRLISYETYPLSLGQMVKGGPPTAVDRQLGLAYGAGAVRALKEGQSGVMVAFQPPDLKFVPLVDGLNKVRVVPSCSVFMETARSLGIALGD